MDRNAFKKTQTWYYVYIELGRKEWYLIIILRSDRKDGIQSKKS